MFTSAFLLFIAVGTADSFPSESTPPLTSITSSDQDWAVYDSHPDHMWNRVFRALYDMRGPDGVEAPLKWPKSLLQQDRRNTVLRVLDEFLSTNAERLIDDSAKRALFQHDLWQIFNWSLAFPFRPDEGDQTALQRRLVKIMRRVALDASEIKALPDNYRAAVDGRVYAAAYSFAARQRPFLPPDLREKTGNWAMLTYGDRPAAYIHAVLNGWQSDLQVFLSVPESKADTQRFVERVNKTSRLPAIPVGTRVVLLRQMLLVDRDGRITRAPIIEKLQMRVYLKTPAAPQYTVAFEPVPSLNIRSIEGQDVFVFHLDRKAYASHRADSLKAVGIDDYGLHLDVASFDPKRPREHLLSGDVARKQGGFRILGVCATCHSPGSSLNSFLHGGAQPVVLREPEQADISPLQLPGYFNGYHYGYLRVLWDTP